MDKEQFLKLEKDTQLEWFINVFNIDLDEGFNDSPEFDEAFEKYIVRMFHSMDEQKLDTLLKEV